MGPPPIGDLRPCGAFHDRRTGETTAASLFVAVLGASTYTFARAALSQDLANWIDCHNPRLCKALLDRVTDRAHIIETGTESFRFKRTMEGRRKK